MAGSILQAVQNYRSAVGSRPTVPMATAANDVNPVNGVNSNVKPNVPVVITTPSARQ